MIFNFSSIAWEFYEKFVSVLYKALQNILWRGVQWKKGPAHDIVQWHDKKYQSYRQSHRSIRNYREVSNLAL